MQPMLGLCRGLELVQHYTNNAPLPDGGGLQLGVVCDTPTANVAASDWACTAMTPTVVTALITDMTSDQRWKKLNSMLPNAAVMARLDAMQQSQHKSQSVVA